MKIFRSPRGLPALFRVDGTISLLFGVATLFFQTQILSTAVDLKGANATGLGDSLIESALFTLSSYYILVGAVLLLFAKIPQVYAMRLSVLIVAHHAAMAVKGILEAERSWITGNPWWDIGIHAIFVAGYMICLIMALQHRQLPDETAA